MHSLRFDTSWKRRVLMRRVLTSFIMLSATYLLWRILQGGEENLIPLHITYAINVLCIVPVLMLLGSFGRYPGTESASPIFTSVAVVYGVAMAVLLIARIDYSRAMLFGGCAVFTIVLFAEQALSGPARRLTIGLIQSEALPIDNIPNVYWIVLDDPFGSVPAVDAVAVDFRYSLDSAWERRLTEMALLNIAVYNLKHLLESLTGRVQLEHISETSYGTLSPSVVYIGIKRIVDVSVSVILLILLWPIMLLTAVSVKIDSQGPAIFRQTRVGFLGKKFVVYKFRTMRVDGHIANERRAAMTVEGDSRITNLGKFLRKSRLDELPQLINVLKGDMSLIGPRPEAEVLSRWYEEEIPFYRYRHIISPGITGWAQINQGHVTDVSDVKEKLYYDFYYIKNVSPWIDLLIIIRTIGTMFSGIGAK